MRLKPSSRLQVIVTAFAFSGCAVLNPGFQPHLPYYYNPASAHQSTTKEVQEGLEVSVEEFVSADKSRQAFDADLASFGVLALGVRIENKGKENYKVQKSEIKASLNKQLLSLIPATQAANQITTSEYRKTLAKDIMAAPVVMVGAVFILAYSLFMAFFTGRIDSPTPGGFPPTAGEFDCWTAVCVINNNVEMHFERLALGDTLLKPHEMKAGFVYFKLPNKVKKLEGLTLEMDLSRESGAKQLTYKLSLPALDIR
ncbi:MAG: hypothetical protein HYY20_02245 [Candidatus Tectomicrobia bacterium]|uniref:Lipoprotein n=1 Tax=Tectimicrobiota bacterium TaxID=2528274 RepID=A0A932FXN7_UNCTE|nr:hypothetical protein [Candidatus Tectomicrobia bacterium]